MVSSTRESGDRRKRDLEEEDGFSFFDRVRASLLDGTDDTQIEQGQDSTILKVNHGDQIWRLMHVSCVFGMTRLSSLTGERTVLDSLLSSAKGAMMAAFDFNNRRENIVQNLREITKDCDLKMTLDFYDTARISRIGAEVLSQHVHRSEYPYQTSAVMGAVRSAVSLPMAILNTVKKIPQISYASTSTSLDQYRFFGRVVPSNDGDAQAAVDFLAQQKSTHLAILYVADEYGTAYRLSVEQAATRAGILTQSVAIPWGQQEQSSEESTRNNMESAVAALVETGYNHFVGIIFRQHLYELIDLGAPLGLVGPGKFWILGDGVSTSSISAISYPKDSVHARALQGLALISTRAASSGGHYQRFLDSFESLTDDQDFLQYFESKSVSQNC